MRRALVVVCVFFIFQQITGINVPLYYGPHLLGPIFSGAHATLVQTTIAGVEVTAIMTAVNVAATYLGFRWIDKFGRKPLAIGGYTGMIVFALVAALGLAFMSGTLRLVVIMIGLDFFIASFAVGVGGTGWTLQGEVFPTAVRGQAAAFAAMIDWLANFALIEVFPVTQNAISLAGVMVVFAGLCALAIVFIWKFLPETKGLPVEEIVGVFEQQQKQSVLSRRPERTAQARMSEAPEAASGMPPQAPGLSGPGSAYRGGPAMRARLPVLCWPFGVTQVTDTFSPGRSFDKMAERLCGEPTVWPSTPVMTDPAVSPAAVAGLLQIVPMTSVPEFTEAIVDGTDRLASLV